LRPIPMHPQYFNVVLVALFRWISLSNLINELQLLIEDVCDFMY